MKIDHQEIQEILNHTLKNGGEFAEVFLEHKETLNIMCEDNKIEKISSGIDEGAGIRLIDHNQVYYAHTNETDLNGLLKVANVLSSAMKQSFQETICLNQKQKHLPTEIQLNPLDISLEQKVDLVKETNQEARTTNASIRQVTVGYSDVIQDVLIANSEGLYVEDQRVRSKLVVNAIAQKNDRIETGFESLGAVSGFELFSEGTHLKLAAQAASRSVLMLDAKPAPAGKMMVILSSEAGGTMVHEACGHGLEADLVQKKLSVYANKLKHQVANDEVSVIDSPILSKKYGSYFYDDEGCKSQENVLIRNGILEDYMYDYHTAKKADRNSTGNGRRQSYKHKPIPRMSNTYIKPGHTDPESIIQSTPLGLYVKKMGGGQVNTITGDFVFEVQEAYLIKNGALTQCVKGVTLTGNGPEVLLSVDLVGNDLGFAIGVCGKEGQGAAVSDAQPTLRIPNLIVGGIVGGEITGDER
jgi:TldD protein